MLKCAVSYTRVSVRVCILKQEVTENNEADKLYALQD